MNLQQIFAGRLAGLILRLLYAGSVTRTCPHSCHSSDALERLDMLEQTYGWNLEMQMKAARDRLRVLEIP